MKEKWKKQQKKNKQRQKGAMGTEAIVKDFTTHSFLLRKKRAFQRYVICGVTLRVKQKCLFLEI